MIVASFPASDATERLFAYVYSVPIGVSMTDLSISGRELEPFAVDDFAFVYLLPQFKLEDELTFTLLANGAEISCTQFGDLIECGSS